MALVDTADAGPASLVRGPGARAAGPDAFDAAHLQAAFAGRKQGRQDPAARPARRGGAGQHLCLRGAAPRAASRRCKPAGRYQGARARAAGRRDPGGAGRGDRGRRLDLARLSPRPTGRWAISSTASASTTARASPAATPGCKAASWPRSVQAGRSTFYCPVCQTMRAHAQPVLARRPLPSLALRRPRPAPSRRSGWCSDADSEMVIFGSVHVLPPGLDWRPAALDAALARGRRPLVRAARRRRRGRGRRPAAPRPAGRPAAGPVALRLLLPGGRRAALIQVADAYGGRTRPAWTACEPWLAEVALAAARLSPRPAPSSRNGVERTLSAGGARERPRQALETPAEQIGLFDQPPPGRADRVAARRR